MRIKITGREEGAIPSEAVVMLAPNSATWLCGMAQRNMPRLKKSVYGQELRQSAELFWVDKPELLPRKGWLASIAWVLSC